MDIFDQCFKIVLNTEGGFTNDPADPGNWTGGSMGRGTCKGTKFGISAAAYPALDIAALTSGQAKALYRRDYWDRIVGDRLPPPVALMAFDAAINNGTHHASIWLQQAAGAAEDGAIGPLTLSAIARIVTQPGGEATLCVEFLIRRLMFMVGLPTWPVFGPGWGRRLFRLPYDSLIFGA